MKENQMDTHDTARRQGITSSAPYFTLLLALAASACANSEDTPATQEPAPTNTQPSMTDTLGRLVDASATCTQPHTICAKLQIPSDMSGTPATIQFVIYDSNGAPTHPPNGYAGLFPSAQVTAGSVQQFELTDGGLQGNYWLLAIIYMPGGRPFDLPTPGLDYVMYQEPQALPLDGKPINLETTIVVSPAK